MTNSDVNEGRGFPLADEEPVATTAPHRVLLFRIVQRALRAEAGVREMQASNKPTGFYAGRRAAAVNDAADLCAVLYGGDYDAAKKALNVATRAAGEAYPDPDQLRDPAVLEPLAQTVTEHMLQAI